MSEADLEGKIAIIGLACRLPDARDDRDLWQNLREGRSSIRAFTDAELLAAGVPQGELAHPEYVRAGSVVSGVELFDPSFFYLSAREAERMDPQLRLFLEGAWEALESAGHDSERFPGSIGVFAGSLLSTYLLANLFTNPREHGASIAGFMRDVPTRMGNDSHYLATRVSYHLNLRGPSVGVATACSTSLVAVHLAAQSLLMGECDMALAGGVSLRFPQIAGYRYERDGILSPDGRCRPFDAAARGTLFGNGMGVVVLRRLADAIAEGDSIRAVILGSAAGNEGSEKAGYAAPGVEGQARVLAEAVRVAGVSPGSISYVEAHGTGTAVGDPIELAALDRVYRRADADGRSCALGSIKANLGHLSVAAGVAGLIKTVLMLEHREIPPQIGFERWNPEHDPSQSRFEIRARLSPFADDRGPLRAAVSSFGMGGTNAHVVLEEAPQLGSASPRLAMRPRASGPPRPRVVLPLSAKSPAALATAIAAARDHLAEHPEQALADVAFTYATGRRTFNHRAALVAADAAEAQRILAGGDGRALLTGAGQPGEHRVAFLFPGQGAQQPGMGADLYRGEPVFREAMDECAELLRPWMEVDLRDALYPAERGLEGPPRDLRRTDLAQPSLFAVEHALARLWMSFGVEPEALLGHSVGEYVAACLAGVFSLPDALRIVAARGRLVQALPTGSMAAVAASPEVVRGFLEDGVSLAAINEPALCTIAGPSDRVSAAVARLSDEGFACRPVATSHAFHSAMMDPAIDALEAIVREAPLRAPRRRFLSNVTGTWIRDDQATSPRYWAEHLRAPVLFADGVRALLEDERRLLLEVGPGQTLATFARRHPDREGRQPVLESTAHARTKGADQAHLLTTLAKLWLLGVPVHWSKVYAREARNRVALPTYPFERRRYFVSPSPATPIAPVAPAAEARSTAKLDLDRWLYTPRWRQTAASRPSGSREARCFLIFTDACGLGAELSRKLLAAGHRVIVASPGSSFEAASASAYRLRPEAPEDHLDLVRALVAARSAPQHIVHAWLVDRDRDRDLTIDRFEASQRLGLYSLLGLAQALHREGLNAPLRLDVLTSDAHLVTGSEALRPEKAPVRVACRVIAQEHTYVRARCVDLPSPPEDDLALRALADRVLGELTGDGAPEPAIALRGPHRWVQELARVEWSAGLFAAQRLRAGGVYLITGGLGQIGSAIATMLFQRFGARLGLLVREPLPESGAALDDEGAKRAERLRRLTALGAEVLVVDADVADEARLRDAIARVEARFGALHGVIHTAGLPGERWDRVLTDTTSRECGWHLVPKAHGAIALDRILAGRDLDFCLLMSSLAGVLGGLRLFAYGAANHYLDAAAERGNARGGRTRWISLDWDVWQHHQDEKRASSAIGKTMDDKAIQPEEGLEIILRALCLDDVAQLAVSTWDLGVRVDQWIRGRGAGDERAAATAEARASNASAAAGSLPAGSLEERIAAIVAAGLGEAKVGLTDDIFELGGDSLLMMRLLAEVRGELGVDVGLAEALNEPTVANLASLVRAQIEARGEAEALLAEMERHERSAVLALLAEIEALAP